MDEGRWTVLERIFHAALELDSAQRGAYIRDACGGDEDLRRRVESLFIHDNSSLAETELSPAGNGPRIGPYRILSKLGAGGMGQVYLAVDSRLGRRVAIKVLPPQYANDVDRKLRFEREARSASALNHPNIITVHDFSSDGKLDYLVMEYVEGKPLDRLIPREGLKLSEALGYAIQMADALACAHAAGIVHRDLKPANVVITGTGTAKVLDFGLAKMAEASRSAQSGSATIMGTAAYMSPEQASGAPVDARSDIFSFGSMLYEMITGCRPFERDSTAATLSAICNDEPPPARTMEDYGHPEMAAVIARCLRKKPAERFGSAAELQAALAAIRGRPGAKRRGNRAWIMAAAALVMVAAAALFSWRPGLEPPPPVFSPTPLTTYPFLESSPGFSPDGSHVAFVWQGSKGDNEDIYVKVVGEYEPVRLTKDPLRDVAPAWSPDGRWIAFLRHLSPGVGKEQPLDERSVLLVMPATGGL
jgi:serine/threonine protein kinase